MILWPHCGSNMIVYGNSFEVKTHHFNRVISAMCHELSFSNLNRFYSPVVCE